MSKSLDEAARKHGFADWAQVSAALPDQEDPFHAIVQAAQDADKSSIKIKIELEFSDKDVADLLCSAIEGGCGREWCKEIDTSFTDAPRAKPWGLEYTPSYIAAPFTADAALIVRVHEHWVGTAGNANDNDFRIQAEYQITRIDLAKGLYAMATKPPKHFAAFLNDTADAITGDVFLQCCTFGEIVFD